MEMKVRCAFDEMVKISDLKPHPQNRNKHPKNQVARFAKILGYQGIRRPVRVSKRSGFMTVGHGMLLAAKLNKWKSLPVNFQEYDSEEQEIADLTADNAIAQWAELDLASINVDVPNLGPDFDIDMLGLKDFSLDPPNFDPGSEGEQGQLDEKQLKFYECPHCEKEFELGQARKIEN